MSDLDIDAIQTRANAATLFGAYAVLEDGTIWSFRNWRGIPCKQVLAYPNSHGYARVRLVDDNGVRKSYMVHALVARKFLGARPSSAHVIRHLDGDRLNNNANNLAWGTPAENAADRERHGRGTKGGANPSSVLTDDLVRSMRAAIAGGASVISQSRLYGISYSQAKRVVAGKAWSHVA